MKKFISISSLIIIAFFSSFNYAQEEDSVSTSEWNFGVETDLYFTDPFIFLPIFIADKGNLHLEARYNYEAQRTVSTWVGYNFSVGKTVTLDVTPMFAGVFGDTNGMALGFEGTLTWRWLELYSESEYVFSIGDWSKSFIYTWSTLTASPTDWLRLGLAVQRTRAYETSLEIQRGFLVGVRTEHMGITAYMFNPDVHTPTYVFAFDLNW